MSKLQWFDRKMGNFHDLRYFPTWMAGGGGHFLDTGYHDKIFSIHEIKTGSYR